MLRYLKYLKNRVFMEPKKDIIAIVGTTGVGKSQFSIDLAKAVDGEVINADSMQIYRGLDQITNKHPVIERDGIVHHLMDFVDWKDEYHIHKFKQDADRAIADIHSRNKVPIIVGGTHYYLLSLLFDNKTVGENATISEKEPSVEEKAVLDGPVEEIFAKLKEFDPVIAQKFHPQDRRKLRRALEIYYQTNRKPSDIYHEQKVDELLQSSLRFNTLVYWVYCSADILKPRLDTRVDKMMDSGALEEIRELYQYYNKIQPNPDLTKGVWQVIGFKEFLKWLESGEQADFVEALDKMKIRTRQYAKKQIKWIRSLLATELVKEAKFNYMYGGKMYVLDSSDLENWKDNVAIRGIAIAEQFKAGNISIEQTPKGLDEVLPSEETLSEMRSNKTIGAEKDWKHYLCSYCVDKSGNPFTAVGKESFEEHTSSRRHKRAVGAQERKRKHEEMLAGRNREAEERSM